MIEVDLELLPAQRKFLECRARTAVFVGGYGSGKTRGLCYKALMLGLENEPCLGMYVMPTYTMIRDVAVPTFQQILTELQIPHRYLANDHVFRIADKFQVLLRSGDRPELLVGINAGWACIDEPALQAEEVFRGVLSRIRDPKSNLLQLALGGTPEGTNNWFFDLCHDPDVEVIRAKTTDNPFLDPSYVEQLAARFTAEEIQAYINGEFVNFDGAWYKTHPPLAPHTDFHGVKIFRQPEECSKQLVLGVDTGGGMDRDACALALVDKRDRHLVASWKDSIASIDRMVGLAQLLFEKFTLKTPPEFPGLYGERKERGPTALVETNGIGHATYQAFLQAGISCTGFATTEGSRYAGLLGVRNAASDGVLKGGDDLREEARLLVTKDGKFVGPKDLSMAIGFCYNHIAKNPFIAPVTEHDRNAIILSHRLSRNRGYWT